MAGEEGVHAGVEEEPQEEPARVAQHHHEGHQRPPGAPDLKVTEVAPVDLGLLAGKGAKAQVGLGLGARTMAGDQMAEVVWVAAIAALIDHGVEPGRGQGRERLEGLQDERQVGVDAHRPLHRPVRRQPGLGQNAGDDIAMDADLTGDGPGSPLLYMVVAQDLGVQFGGDDHRRPQGGRDRTARRRRR